MDIKQALEVLQHGIEDGFLPEGTTLKTTDKQVKQVVSKEGAVLGSAFEWKGALTYALKPGMEEYAKKVKEAKDRLRRDTAAFMAFLMDKYHAEFEEWRKTNDPGSNESGNEPDPKRVVQIVQP